MVGMLAGVKKNAESKTDSKIFFTVSILSSDFSHSTWQSKSSQKGHAWQIVLPAQFRLKWKRMSGEFISWHGLQLNRCHKCDKNCYEYKAFSLLLNYVSSFPLLNVNLPNTLSPVNDIFLSAHTPFTLTLKQETSMAFPQ